MSAITVFTPTFNRAYCLDQLYESLKRQTSKDFTWLVIDDGSKDNTKELVQSWIDENAIQIRYIYQENQGMHSAHNTAYQNIDSELNVCIDSDDYMTDDAVFNILQTWETNKQPHLAGIIGLDAFKSGELVGTKIPEHVKESTLTAIYQKYHVKGDKKVVLRTSIIQEFPLYPVYKNERLVPLGTLYLMIDQKYKFICANQVYCIVEYLPDGSSNNILKQYKKSPRGFAYNRKIKMQFANGFSEKFKNATHLVSSSIFARDLSLLFQSPDKVMTLLAVPMGIALNFYIRYKTRNT